MRQIAVAPIALVSIVQWKEETMEGQLPEEIQGELPEEQQPVVTQVAPQAEVTVETQEGIRLVQPAETQPELPVEIPEVQVREILRPEEALQPVAAAPVHPPGAVSHHVFHRVPPPAVHPMRIAVLWIVQTQASANLLRVKGV